MTESSTFVIVGLQPWYTAIGSNCKHIAKNLSKNNKVLYINASLDRRSVLNKKDNKDIAHHIEVTKNGKGFLNQIDENIWEFYPARILESINWIPNTWLFQKFNYVNNKRFAKDIQEALNLLSIKDFYLFNDNEIFRAFYLKDLLKPKAYIYYCRDYLLGVDYWKKHGEKLEPLHIKNADYAMANSSYLASYLKKYNSNSIDVGQGCDTEMFNGFLERIIPEDLLSIKGEKIGYVGALNSLRLDITCLEYIAKERPDWQIVLVGPEDDDFRKSELHQLKNVHFLGQKKLDELPSYIAGFDVCLNPQRINEVTIGNYPLKIDEYLNMGKPVVATKTEAMQLFESYTYLATNPQEYVYFIERALDEDSEENMNKRINFANQHTWDNSVAKIVNALI
jgi:teichuronic acid biosynthesis glycosyltransferase TuaH